MSRKKAYEFFLQIIKNSELKNEIQNISSKYSKYDNIIEDIINLLDNEIVPLGKKYGYEFTSVEILEVESLIYYSKKQLLSEDVISSINGGKVLKSPSIYTLSALMCLMMLPQNSSAYSKLSHDWTTKTGVEALLQAKIEDENYYNMFTDEVKQQLEASCNKPDSDENQHVFAYHFYDPATEKNFRGGDITALSKFCSHFSNAVDLYKKDDKNKSLEELARSLHFLEDLNTPVHVHNQAVISAGIDAKRHADFEKTCDEVRESMTVDKISLSEKDFLEIDDLSLEDFGKKCAIESRDLYTMFTNNYEKERDIAKSSIANAQKAVALALDKFYKAVTDGQNTSIKRIDASTQKKIKYKKELAKRESHSYTMMIGKRLVKERYISFGEENYYEKSDGTTAYSKMVNVTDVIRAGKANKKNNNGIKAVYSFTVEFIYDGSKVESINKDRNINKSFVLFDKNMYQINGEMPLSLFNREDKNCAKLEYRLYKKEGIFNKIFNINCGWEQIANLGVEVQCSPNGHIEVY